VKGVSNEKGAVFTPRPLCIPEPFEAGGYLPFTFASD
jgi:hypothetical protein